MGEETSTGAAGPAERAGAPAVLDHYFDGVNGERYEDVAALFTPEGTLHAPGFPVQRGPQEIGPYFERVLAAYPVHHDQPTRFDVVNGAVTVHISFKGELASGAPLSFDAVDVFDFARDGRIERLTTWYDSRAVFARLTSAEALRAPSAAERARLASLAEATPERLRAALTVVRTGEQVGLGEQAMWRRLPREVTAVTARAVMVDLREHHGPITAEALLEAAAARRARIRPGDVVMVESGGGAIATQGAPPSEVAAIVSDGSFAGPWAQIVLGENWSLGSARAACAARGRWTGLLISVPGRGEQDVRISANAVLCV